MIEPMTDEEAAEFEEREPEKAAKVRELADKVMAGELSFEEVAVMLLLD
jgi:hypothetical protein